MEGSGQFEQQNLGSFENVTCVLGRHGLAWLEAMLRLQFCMIALDFHHRLERGHLPEVGAQLSGNGGRQRCSGNVPPPQHPLNSVMHS